MAANRQDSPACPCPCGSGNLYAACCEPWHNGAAAPTAEALMRSRYSAYVLEMENYLLGTWHTNTRPPTLAFDVEQKPQWLGLEIKHSEVTGLDNAIVEFVARYKVAGKAHRLHEISQFVREDERWYYVSGQFSADK